EVRLVQHQQVEGRQPRPRLPLGAQERGQRPGDDARPLDQMRLQPRQRLLQPLEPRPPRLGLGLQPRQPLGPRRPCRLDRPPAPPPPRPPPPPAPPRRPPPAPQCRAPGRLVLLHLSPQRPGVRLGLLAPARRLGPRPLGRLRLPPGLRLAQPRRQLRLPPLGL